MPDETVSTTSVESVPVASPEPLVVTEPQGEQSEVQPEALDPSYVSLASAFGLTEDDLRATSRDVVERMMANADRIAITTYRQETPQTPPPRRENGQFTSASPEDFAFDPFELQFGEAEEIPEPVVKNMAGLKDWAAKQIEKVHKHYEAKFKEMTGFRDDVITQHNNATVDRFVESQGSEWESVFGKGATVDLNPQSQEFLNRVEVWTAANAMVQRSAQQGRRMSLNEALPRARNAMFMEKAFAIERAKASDKRTQLQSGAAEKPRTPGGVPAPLTIKDRAQRLREAAMRA